MRVGLESVARTLMKLVKLPERASCLEHQANSTIVSFLLHWEDGCVSRLSGHINFCKDGDVYTIVDNTLSATAPDQERKRVRLWIISDPQLDIQMTEWLDEAFKEVWCD